MRKLVLIFSTFMFISCNCEILTTPCSKDLILAVTKSDTTCGSDDGQISVDVAGGKAPYTFRWEHDPSSNTHIIGQLTTGLYQVTITDQDGKQTVSQIIIN